MKEEKNYKIGLRTIKTGVAVGLSMFIASLFNLKSPIFTGIAAVMAMQSSVSESFKYGKDRMLGTIVGALIGLLFSYFLPYNYLFMALGTIVVIYIHNILGWNKSLSLSAIVFLAIFINTEGARLPYATNRVIDTFIGISVSVMINYFVLAPNTKESFIQRKMEIIKISRELIYNLVKNREEVPLGDLSKGIRSLEQTYKIYKEELKLHITKGSLGENSITILSLLDDVYKELETIIRLDMRPILNAENAQLFMKIYSEEFIPHARDNNEMDVVYNYHLDNIFNNIIRIENLLKEGSRE